MNKDTFNLKDILLPKPSTSKEEAINRIKATEINNTVLNALNMADYLPEDLINMTKIMTSGQVAAADAEAQKYKIPNSIHQFDNPFDKIKEKIVKNIARGTFEQGQKAIQWGKDFKRDFPQIKQNFINKLDNDLNIPKKWNEALNAEFSLGEFEINKPVKSINIDNNGNIYTPTSKFKGYRNPLTKDNRIYSREDIGSFNTNEFNNTEAEIRAQWGKIGIPSNGELEVDRLNNNGTVFVKGYTRSDGTKVKSHYRAK